MEKSDYIKMLERKLGRLEKSDRYPNDHGYLNAYKNIERKLKECKKDLLTIKL